MTTSFVEARVSRYVAIYYTTDPDEMGPDLEAHEDLSEPGDDITIAEAHKRAAALRKQHPKAWGYEVYERTNIRWDYGWEWTLNLVEKP